MIYQIIIRPSSGDQISDTADDAYELNKQLRPKDGVLFEHNDRVYRPHMTWEEVDLTIGKKHD